MKLRLGVMAFLSTVAGAALVAGLAPANATVVATIVGGYDIGGGNEYDTPALLMTNSSGGTITNIKMQLLGYQPGTLNFGKSQTVTGFGSLANGLTATYVWGSLPGDANYPTSGPGGNLASYDYDDEWGNTPPGYTNSGCKVTTTLCSLVGNFRVTLTGTIAGGTFNGDPVFAVFSPTTNFTGGFVGWEGLDPTGLSETSFDEHSGTFSGTMAIVQIGTPFTVPELSTWVMMILGFAGLGLAGYRAGRGVATGA